MPAPLTAVSCAQVLEDASSRRRPVVISITTQELELVRRVPADADSIREFLAELFPAPNAAVNDRLRLNFESLWRRVPEMLPPDLDYISAREPTSIVTAWLQYLAALASLPILHIDLRWTPDLRLEIDDRARRHLGDVPPDLLQEIRNLPWDAKTIITWLRARYPKRCVRQSGWAEEAFTFLWRDLFGARKPWSRLAKFDADGVIYRTLRQPPHRILQEWRLLIVALNFHQRPPVGKGDVPWN